MKSILLLFLACLTLCPPGLAQWSPWTEQTTGLPAGYYVGALHAVDSNVVWGIGWNDQNPSHYFIRTTNGGTTWTCNAISPAPATLSVAGVFAIDDKKAWVVMLSTRAGPSYQSGGLFSTIDGGATWQKDPTAFTTIGGAGCFVHFFDANNGVTVGSPDLGGGYFEIYTTSNGGANWARVPKENIPPPLTTEMIQIGEYTASANCLWFPTYPLSGGKGRYFRSTDKGLTWSLHVMPNAESRWTLPTLEFQNDSIGLGQASQAGILRTTDGGVTWNLIPNTSWLGLGHLESVPTAPGMFVASSVYNGQSPPSQYVGTVATIDGGANWTRIGHFARDYPDLGFASPAAGWRTRPGDSHIYKFTIPSGRLIGASPDSVSYASTKTGESADTVAVDIANYGTDPLQVTGIVPPDSNFAIIQQPTFPLTLTTLQSARLTFTFTPKAGGMLEDSIIVTSDASNPAGSRIFLSGEGFVAQEASPGLLYAASNVLFRINTKSGMITWIDSLQTLPIHSLTVDWSEYGLYGVSAKPNVSMLYRIDCGTGATMLVRTFPVGDLRAIAFSRENVLYGATIWGDLCQLNVTTGAVTYVGSSSDVAFTSLACSPSGKLWASGYVGSTYDNIFTVNIGTGEVALVGRTGGNAHVPAIAFDPRGNLYGLTGAGADTNAIIIIDTLTGAGAKLFSTGTTGLLAISMNPVVTVTGTLPVSGVPGVFALEQNYPNPFNPKTGIRFRVPGVSDVTITVHDMLGRMVKVVVNERKAPGVYEVSFDGSGLASGVYFYRMTAGNFTQSRKMLLIR